MGIKNPLNLCMAVEATIGMAGMLLEMVCVDLLIYKVGRGVLIC